MTNHHRVIMSKLGNETAKMPSSLCLINLISGVEGTRTDMDRFPFSCFPFDSPRTLIDKRVLTILKGKHARARADHTPSIMAHSPPRFSLCPLDRLVSLSSMSSLCYAVVYILLALECNRYRTVLETLSLPSVQASPRVPFARLPSRAATRNPSRLCP